MTGNFVRRTFDVFEKYGIEYMPPMFVGVLKPWGETECYVLEEATRNPEIRNQINKVNTAAINAPAGTRVLGEYKLKEYFIYRKARRQLFKMLKQNKIKTYTWADKEKYLNDYDNKKLKELEKARAQSL